MKFLCLLAASFFLVCGMLMLISFVRYRRELRRLKKPDDFARRQEEVVLAALTWSEVPHNEWVQSNLMEKVRQMKAAPVKGRGRRTRDDEENQVSAG